MNLFEFSHFTYAYSGQNPALNQIDLLIPKGSFTILTGSNGSGKTTLCRALGGIIPHYMGGNLAGNILFKGQSTLTTALSDLSDQVGIVFDDYESQLVTLTVAEEVAFTLENQGLSASEISTRREKVLNQVGLGGLEKREVSSLSGGQKQRLVLASVLAADPEILVLDEPASALDPEGRQKLYQLLGELHQTGLTIVVAEHDLAPLLPVADRLAVLLDGSLVTQGTVTDVLITMQHEPQLQPILPPLWQLKTLLEEDNQLTLENWLTEAEALTELTRRLTD